MDRDAALRRALVRWRDVAVFELMKATRGPEMLLGRFERGVALGMQAAAAAVGLDVQLREPGAR